MVTAPRPDLQAHYGRERLFETVEGLLGRLADGSADPAGVAAALARMDEFHPGGAQATVQLAALAGPLDGLRVLDLGCGVGGPARALRRLVGPAGAVTGVDAVAAYCAVARVLNGRAAGAADIVIELADAVAVDLPGPRFDLVWSQQAQMNIADKAGWVASVARHLRPGGRYVFQETFAGEGGSPHFPVPWAATAGASWLAAPEAWRGLLESAGFAAGHWRDISADARAWLSEAVDVQRRLARAGDPAAALNVGVLLGPDAALMSRHLAANLDEGRLRIFAGVFTRRP